MKTCNTFTGLLLKFFHSGRQIAIIHPSLGAVKGRIVDVTQDYIKFLVLDSESEIFYNMYIPITCVMGIEEVDNEES
jgi:hypothetical protein